MSELVLQVPRGLRRGGKAGDEDESVDSGLQLIQLMCRKLGIADLGASTVLDMGCGCKLVQAMLEKDLPIGHYVGVDVFPDLIEFLDTTVTDPRFDFHVLNTHNEMYNKEGEPLSANTRLPVADTALISFACTLFLRTWRHMTTWPCYKCCGAISNRAAR